MRRFTLGNIHQSSSGFDCYGKGYQCTIIAAVAIFAFLSGRFSQPERWTPQNIDQIVLNGSMLYDNSMHHQNPRYLAHSDIPNYLEMWNIIYETTVHDDIFYGVVGHQGNYESLAIDIRTALHEALQVSHTLVFTASDYTISIFLHNSEIYVFDSHQRNELGLVNSTRGAAVLLRFSTIDECVRYLEVMYHNAMFNLSPLVVNLQNTQIQGASYGSSYNHFDSTGIQCDTFGSSHNDNDNTQAQVASYDRISDADHTCSLEINKILHESQNV